MKYALIVALVFAVGCSGSPTAPTTTTVTAVAPPVVVPPVVTPPIITPPPTPTRNPLLDDPRFSLTFYRQMVNDAFDNPAHPQPLRRFTSAPRIYLRTIDEAGRDIDANTLSQTAGALINTAGSLTGVFGVGGLERGRDTRHGQSGWITVYWMDQATSYCGAATIGGSTIHLAPRTPGCRCAGGPAVRLKTVKHELGHALGFYHTDSPDDLMSSGGAACDKNPSDREIFHARIAYQMPLGSLDPQ